MGGIVLRGMHGLGDTTENCCTRCKIIYRVVKRTMKANLNCYTNSESLLYTDLSKKMLFVACPSRLFKAQLSVQPLPSQPAWPDK